MFIYIHTYLCMYCTCINTYFRRSHIENKHIDCFQYKCPLCRTTKTSRLAFDCHTRSRHGAVDKLSVSPLLRLKRQFSVKTEKSRAGRKSSHGDENGGGGHSGKDVDTSDGDSTRLSAIGKPERSKSKGGYDLLFLTFLRYIRI